MPSEMARPHTVNSTRPLFGVHRWKTSWSIDAVDPRRLVTVFDCNQGCHLWLTDRSIQGQSGCMRRLRLATAILYSMAGTVLVVDDDEDIRDSLSLVLEDEGCEVRTASNGAQALSWLRANPTSARLVLLDLMMPVMDGRSFLRAKEADPDIASVPVVVLTASGQCRELLRSHDVQDCLAKPIRYEKVLEAVGRCTSSAPPHA